MMKTIITTLAAIMLIAVLTNFGNLYNTLSYSKHSTRGVSELDIRGDGSSNEENKTSGLDRDYITQWSYGIEESLTFIIPNAKGGATSQMASDADARGCSSKSMSMINDLNNERRSVVRLEQSVELLIIHLLEGVFAVQFNHTLKSRVRILSLCEVNLGN